MKGLVGALLALFIIAGRSGAQDGQLAARLDKETLDAVTAIIDSARAAKLPVKPLHDKALEGVAKGSDDQRIIIAVRLLATRMATARAILRSNAGPEEIKLAAEALESGVPIHEIALLQSVSGKRATTMTLFVLNDLIARQVPIPTATDVVLQLARSKAKDGDLIIFQRNVRADIDRGADPTIAATTRARGLVQSTSVPSKR